MSWFGAWDVGKLQSATSKALKSAQKRIDQALDIKEEEAGNEDFFGQFGINDGAHTSGSLSENRSSFTSKASAATPASDASREKKALTPAPTLQASRMEASLVGDWVSESIMQTSEANVELQDTPESDWFASVGSERTTSSLESQNLSKPDQWVEGQSSSKGTHAEYQNQITMKNKSRPLQLEMLKEVKSKKSVAIIPKESASLEKDSAVCDVKDSASSDLKDLASSDPKVSTSSDVKESASSHLKDPASSSSENMTSSDQKTPENYNSEEAMCTELNKPASNYLMDTKCTNDPVTDAAPRISLPVQSSLRSDDAADDIKFNIADSAFSNETRDAGSTFPATGPLTREESDAEFPTDLPSTVTEMLQTELELRSLDTCKGVTNTEESESGETQVDIQSEGTMSLAPNLEEEVAPDTAANFNLEGKVTEQAYAGAGEARAPDIIAESPALGLPEPTAPLSDGQHSSTRQQKPDTEGRSLDQSTNSESLTLSSSMSDSTLTSMRHSTSDLESASAAAPTPTNVSPQTAGQQEELQKQKDPNATLVVDEPDSLVSASEEQQQDSKESSRSSSRGHQGSKPQASPDAGAELHSSNSSDIEVISVSAASMCSPVTPRQRLPLVAHHHRSESDSSFLSVEDDQALALHRRLVDMKEVLEAREQKVLQLNRENMELCELVETLKAQLSRSEEARQSNQTDLNSLTEEFTSRIADAERRFQQAVKERESLRRQMALPSDALREKEQQVAELMQEGEKMAQEQLKINNLLKKLRAREKELESQLAQKEKRQKVAEEEAQRLRRQCEESDEAGRRHAEAVMQLTKAVQRLERDLQTKQKEADEGAEKQRSLSSLLEAANRQVAEMQRQLASSAAETHEAALSAELAAKEQLKTALRDAKDQATKEVQRLETTVEELRMALAAQSRDAALQESLLRDELRRATRRLEEAELRAEELASAASQASQPLLRQLEGLQKAHAAAQLSWETVEEQLNARVAAAERSAQSAKESEKRVRERLRELEEAAAGTSQTEGQLRQQVAEAQAAANAADRARVSATDRVQQLQQELKDAHSRADQLQQQLRRYESRLQAETARADSESRRATDARDQMLTCEATVKQLREQLSQQSGLQQQQQQQQQQQDSQLQRSNSNEPGSPHSAAPAASSEATPYSLVKNAAGMTAMVERLREELQMRQSETANLTADLRAVERSREHTANELAAVLSREESLASNIAELEATVQELNTRYEALLQMYGEKMEENEELRLDLQDVKEMYRNQIDLLTQARS